jgi:phosphatidylserine decarboxylase
MKQAAKTPTRWYPIPIALGAIVILAVQLRKQMGGPGSETFEVTSQGEQGAVLKSRNVDGPWQVSLLAHFDDESEADL